MSYLELFRLVSPEATVTATALIVLALGLLKKQVATLMMTVAAAGVIAAAVAVLLVPANGAIFGGMLVLTPLNNLFKVICLSLTLLTLLLATGERASRDRGEFVALILLAAVGLMLLVGSEELLMIFIGLELTGLSLYVLTAFDKADRRSAEAGLKYFLFGSTASAFALFGLSLLYGTTGSTALSVIGHTLGKQTPQPLLLVAIVMTLVGFAFKIAAAPFHLWAPDAYQAAPAASAAFISSASKVASFVVLGKIVLLGLAPLHGSADWHGMAAGWAPVLAAIAALSILSGNLVALAQTNVRRLLAYSAVAHAGYTLLGLIAGGRTGFAATLFYTTIYGFTLVGAFAVIGLVRRDTGGDELADFSGLSARSPLLAGCMALFLLSLAGLPPLPGFFGKFYLFSAAFAAGPKHGLLWLVALALVGSLISLYYYLMVLKTIYVSTRAYEVAAPGTQLRGTESRWSAGINLTFPQRAWLIAVAGLVLVAGIMPSLLLAPILRALP